MYIIKTHMRAVEKANARKDQNKLSEYLNFEFPVGSNFAAQVLHLTNQIFCVKLIVEKT